MIDWDKPLETDTGVPVTVIHEENGRNTVCVLFPAGLSPVRKDAVGGTPDDGISGLSWYYRRRTGEFLTAFSDTDNYYRIRNVAPPPPSPLRRARRIRL